MYKMLACDFSHALINEEEAIFLSTMIELDRMRKEGILFTVTTEKPFSYVLNYNLDFPFLDYIVCLDGACVYACASKKFLIKKRIVSSVVKKILKEYREKKIVVSTLDQIYCLPTNVFDEKEQKEIYRIQIFFDTKKEYLSSYQKLVSIPSISVWKEEESRSLCMIAKGCSKFLGVKKILETKKESFSHVLFVGAKENDKEIMKHAGYSVTVKNAPKEIKKEAKEVFPSADDKGFEKIIKKFF